MGKEQKQSANERLGREQPYDIHNESHISQSGNSDVHVDINIQIDVTPIALAMLYSLFADKKLSANELELAVQRIEATKMKQERSESNGE